MPLTAWITVSMPPLTATAICSGNSASRSVSVLAFIAMLPATFLISSSSAIGRSPLPDAFGSATKSLSPSSAAISSLTSPLAMSSRKGTSRDAMHSSFSSHTLRCSVRI